MEAQIAARRITIKGIVQGVGFRPHVYRLAMEFGLKGWVLNSSAGLFIEVEGEPASIEGFVKKIIDQPPPLALIRSCQVEEVSPQGYEDFSIRESESQESREVMISPDIAICKDCKSEVLDPCDHRYFYPFINCTNCGPRFTIIKDVPYDRPMTTMAAFPMCSQCQAEYEDPLNRRFHAQPNACPVCGPHTLLLNSGGQVVDTPVVELLKQGFIVAVKGLGGFHLAVNATDSEAVSRLRRRKLRDAKPFAVMVRDLDAAKKYCYVDNDEETWLQSQQAPIMILKRREEAWLPGGFIHPGLDTLGVMLPYTALHYLLFDEEIEILIMTSANLSNEPLITGNDEVLKELAEVADYFLVHDREIFNPCDDSVMLVTSGGSPHLFRRARGFVPRGVKIPAGGEPVLALGGEMKNTFCITRKGEAFLSQHWGDLNHYNNYRNFLEGIERFKNMLDVNPQVIAHDLHPEYQTTRWARQQGHLERIAVQHHHAHMASVMAENGLHEEVLGLICDGTGWGTDGAVWGCELFKGNYNGYERLAHLKYMPLPGGDLTALKPYRMAYVYLYQLLGEDAAEYAAKYLSALGQAERDVLNNRLGTGSKELLTSSCGRLFDAVSSLLGVCQVNDYEGQAAAELEALADQEETGCYSYAIEQEGGMMTINMLPMLSELLDEISMGREKGRMAQKFHLSLAAGFTDLLTKARDMTGIQKVAVSGGVFHNQVLLYYLVDRLEQAGLEVYQHQQVPAGDGGISLGQAMIASEVTGNVSGSTR